ncbi:hypothetical protein [Brevundimonas pishanensis]|uniref:hypothetical protein n=1 Tax=Brevundimonas pishanensis TaxID=2896315 RepID=UPI001FA798D9|nr:hypothetical protein [Brevundimonas pishanensis]
MSLKPEGEKPLYIILIFLGCVLTVVGVRELVISQAKRKLPSPNAAVLIALLGLGPCVAGGIIAPGEESAPSAAITE